MIFAELYKYMLRYSFYHFFGRPDRLGRISIDILFDTPNVAAE
jgi:hypothetical protein